jgi:3-oxoacyl-[acyl-carrier protein] reductase
MNSLTIESSRAVSVALVTGGGRGLGRAMSHVLAGMGFVVAVNYVRRSDAALETVAAIQAAGGHAAVFQADVADPNQAQRLVEAVETNLGPIGVLVNNAGIGPIVNLDQLGPADWRNVISANLDSAYFVTRAVIPGMRSRRSGRLVFMSSIASRNGGVISAAYAASKAGIEGLMHYCAAQLLADGITANAIAPAFVESDMTAAFSSVGAPLGRKGRPDEVGNVLKMIVETEYITGQTIHLNAGRYPT